jgi:hypothetical protein
MGERVARLEVELRELRRDHDGLYVAVEGPPRVESVKGRLHTLEASEAATAVASQALAQAQADKREARAERVRAEASRWSWRWKALAAATSVALAVAPYVTLAVHN